MKQIALTRNQFTSVDDEDFEYLNQWKWYAMPGRNKFYAQRTEYSYNDLKQKIKIIHTIHSEIMKIHSKEFIVDHKDGNGLNNQKSNLRICTHLQNSFNRLKQFNPASSKYKGVSRGKTRNKWRSQIMVDRKTIDLGSYYKQEDAALAYNIAAKKYFGEFANLNQIDHVMVG